MASSSDPSDIPADEVPPNLLLNPRAHVLKSATAPLAQVPSTNSISHPAEPLSPEDEKSRVAQCLEHKATGNKYFTSTPPDYELAISYYRSALESCPARITEHVSVLHANIAAAYIKLERWKEAEEAATKSLTSTGEDDDILKERAARKRAKIQKEEKEAKERAAANVATGENKAVGNSAGRIEEVDDDEEEDTVEWGKNWKARLRRAKAREMQDTWQCLTDGLEDYKILASRSFHTQPIPAVDRKNIQAAISRIPPRIEEQKQKEVAEMMGKLKGLGDTILKPFGLSTNNFQMVKDEKSGGYSLNFNQGK